MQKNKRVLFTIPFAGGSGFSFKNFDRHLEDIFDIYHLELPGRGYRVTEELIDDIYQAKDDLFEQIRDKISDDYVVYGHSLGAILGYLLVLEIEERGLPKPSKLVVSGKRAPQNRSTVIRHNLPLDSFISSLKELGGMPEDFFEHRELFEFFEPILRADFKMAEEFNLKEIKKIDSKISVLYGIDDSYSIEEALDWKYFSKKSIDFYKFSGNHFFIFNHLKEICNIIASK